MKDAAEELKKRALRNDYDALVVIAPPKALGVLRKELHKEVERRIVLTHQQGNDRPADPRHRGIAGRRGRAARLKPGASSDCYASADFNMEGDMKKLLILALLATATPALAQTAPTTAISQLGPEQRLAQHQRRRAKPADPRPRAVQRRGGDPGPDRRRGDGRQQPADGFGRSPRCAAPGSPSATSRPRRSACSRAIPIPSRRRRCARG